jgi:hypothetical protein
LTLAAVAGAGFLVFLLAMPETGAQDETMRPAAHAGEPRGDTAVAARQVVAR